jgi:hypothetical protein
MEIIHSIVFEGFTGFGQHLTDSVVVLVAPLMGKGFGGNCLTI